MTLPSRMLLVGCGNMGGGMLTGWLRGGISPETFTIVDPYLDSAPDGVRLLREMPDETFDAVLLGIKPQMLADAAPTIRPVLKPDTTLFSILAGVELSTLASRFPDVAGIVRVMPNLSVALGKSPIALAADNPGPAQKAMAEDLMAPLGQAEWIGEDTFDLVTALAGSGPGFVYRVIDALGTAATRLGLDGEQAQRLALATVDGAAALAAQSEHSPAELARRVASPGGVTQAGLDTLDADDRLVSLMTDTLRDASARSAEMSAEARKGG